MTPTPVDHAEAHSTELRTRLTRALHSLKEYLDAEDNDARWAAWSCKMLLIGAITDSSLTSVQAWTYARGHFSQCFRDTNRGAEALAIYGRVLAVLNGK